MEEQEAPEQLDLREYLHILNRRKPVVILTLLIVLFLDIAYSYTETPVYSAHATVLIPQEAANADIANSGAPAAQTEQRTLSDDQAFASGASVTAAANKSLGFSAHVKVTSSSSADVLTFTASSTKKADAATIANAYANAYIGEWRAEQVSQYTQQVTALQTEIRQLTVTANSLPSTQQTSLRDAIATLTQTSEQTSAAALVTPQTGPALLDPATEPTRASSPRPVRNGAIGFVVGLLLGIGFALLFERFDDGITSREIAERATGGLPIVGLIPMVEAWSKGSHHLALKEDPVSPVSEAYRTLRTAIQFLGIESPKPVIGVTSSLPGEGKTTAVANLAVCFARAGQRVIVVSCDLRRPTIHEFFGDNDRHGLTSVLLGGTRLADAVHPVEGEPRLRIMPCGPIPPNPAEILSLDRVREVINVLSDNCDVVLLDCPPVLFITDALLLSRLVDGMLVLASTKSTSWRDLRRTVEMLNQVQAPLMGTILNRVPIGTGYAYGYGSYDGYGGYYNYSAKDGTGNGTDPDTTADTDDPGVGRDRSLTHIHGLPPVTGEGLEMTHNGAYQRTETSTLTAEQPRDVRDDRSEPDRSNGWDAIVRPVPTYNDLDPASEYPTPPPDGGSDPYDLTAPESDPRQG